MPGKVVIKLMVTSAVGPISEKMYLLAKILIGLDAETETSALYIVEADKLLKAPNSTGPTLKSAVVTRCMTHSQVL
jgi:hypothetical protein